MVVLYVQYQYVRIDVLVQYCTVLTVCLHVSTPSLHHSIHVVSGRCVYVSMSSTVTVSTDLDSGCCVAIGLWCQATTKKTLPK